MKRIGQIIQALLFCLIFLASCDLFSPADAPAAPVISLANGTYRSAQNLTLSQADGATIYYTLDGSDPSAASTAYSSPIAMNANGAYTVKAIAYKESAASPIAEANIVIDITSMSGTVTFGATVMQRGNVKIGLFLQDKATINICEEVKDRETSGARIFVNTSPSGSVKGEPVALSPMAYGTINTATGAYTLTLPDPGTRASTDEIYAVGWYDADGDGKLDLLREDASVTSHEYFDDGEYNRFARRTVPIGGANTLSHVSFIAPNDAFSAYKFKYYDVTNDSNYATIEQSPAAGAGFDFDIAATVDVN